ncbi:MAG: osmoprotectant NAGGN system M42 family peptidase [Actinobacteria bacterium]|nr:osmoprotectant NAGGN system M42 family peptidase [Actinomycetota bacterium]
MTVKPLPIDLDWVTEVMIELLRTPSPTGRTDRIMHDLGALLTDLGIEFEMTRRGALLAEVPGDQNSPDRAVVVHADTIGAMVARIDPSGRLELTPIGTHSARFAEGARATVFTDHPDVFFTGTILPLLASGHAYGEAVDTQGIGWDHVNLRLDERVASAADVEALGIRIGDFVTFHTMPEITTSGFVKSRHLDDKAGVAAALGAFKAIVEEDVRLPVSAHLLITIAEEVGHGASHGLHEDVAEMVSIDSAVVAPNQASTEFGVTVAMQDMTGPFDFHLTRKLLRLCDEHALPFARDVFKMYRSDIAAALEAGAEMRAALIGFGVDATHGHERTHLDSIRAVAELVTVYLQTELTFRQWDAEPHGALEDFPTRDQPAPQQPRVEG